MALGVIARKCGSLRPVLAGPTGCLRSRWRSGFRKWRHDAVSRARVGKRRAPVGALRLRDEVRSNHCSRCREAPRTCRCIKTVSSAGPVGEDELVGKRRAPVGALRHRAVRVHDVFPRVGKRRAPVGALRLGCASLAAPLPRREAPRTCRCIKTG